MSVPMADPEGDDLLPLSALNALLYCDRRAALRHVEGHYVHNQHTRGGDLLHRRADRPGFERRKGVRTERGLWVASTRLGLYGRADLVEFRRAQGARGEEVPYPVEYKHGRARRWSNDDIQLCAQAMCLEEMLGVPVPAGAIYHARSRSRREVTFDAPLRAETEAAADRLRQIIDTRKIPPPVRKPQCRGCSLRPVCLPDIFSHADRVSLLAGSLFDPCLSDPQP